MASAYRQTPWEALHDPHLPFNLTVNRCARHFQRVALEQAMPMQADDLGIGRIIALLNQIAEK